MSAPGSAAPPCPGCGAPRSGGSECPRCGILYAKAEARAAQLQDLEAPGVGPGATEALLNRQDARRELRARALAIPVALAGALALAHSGTGHFLLRTFLSMWVHELGHAVAAWFCGIPAAPGPWKTTSWETRSPFLVLVFLAGLAWAAYRAWKAERRVWLALLGGVLLAQLFCTFGLRLAAAHTLVTFCGDAGCFVLGTVLMCSLYAPAESALRTQRLRWGLLAIGAAAFVDAGNTWWTARHDVDAIPFGVQEGVGLSDPSRLTELAGWSVSQLVQRYVAVMGLCAAALAIAYVAGLWRARQELRQTDAA